MDTQALSDRIKLGLIASQSNFKTLAKTLGISKQALSHVVNGRVKESRHHAAIAKAIGCSEDWLVYGTGTAPAWAMAPQASQVDETKVRRLETLIDALTHRVDQLQAENAELRARLGKKKSG